MTPQAHPGITAAKSLIVCRCEEVTVQALEDAVASGLDTPRQWKMKTRATMGACQGRVCRQLVELWARATVPEQKRSVEYLSHRPPVRPVTFGQLAREDGQDG